MRRQQFIKYFGEIPIWYDDGSVFIDITQTVRALQAKKTGNGYYFKGSLYNIHADYNDKFYYVKDMAGSYTHYFRIMDAEITAAEIKDPLSDNFYVGDMIIYDAVQLVALSTVETLLLDKTELEDATILI